MQWKSKDTTDAGIVLRLLAKQGEPLLKQLDDGVSVERLNTQAQESAAKHSERKEDQIADNRGRVIEGAEPILTNQPKPPLTRISPVRVSSAK